MKDQLIKTVFYHKAIHTYNEVHTNTTISILYTSTHISYLKCGGWTLINFTKQLIWYFLCIVLPGDGEVSLENCHVGKDKKPKTKIPLLAMIPYYFLLQVTRYHLLGLGMAHLLGETIY